MQSTRIGNRELEVFSKNWIWFLTFGILIEILGLFALFSLAAATLVSVVLLGFLLLMGGIIVIIASFAAWRHSVPNLILQLILGALYFCAGLLLIKNPILGSVSITFFLGIVFIIIGLFRLIDSLLYRYPHWGWVFVNGIITLLLGILIMMNWPFSSLYIIGLFVGIDLIFCGWAYIMGAIGAHNYMKK